VQLVRVAVLVLLVVKVLLDRKDSLLQVLVVLLVLLVLLDSKVLAVYMDQQVLLDLREFRPRREELVQLVCTGQPVLQDHKGQPVQQELLVHLVEQALKVEQALLVQLAHKDQQAH
jgi:hypothetical protein